MLTLDLLISLLLLAAFHAALVLVIPILPLAAGTRLINLAQEARLPITPVIETAALALGIVIGAFLLAQHLPPGSLGFSAIFNEEGIWKISLEQFLLERVNPANYPLQDVLLPATLPFARFGLIQQGLLPAAAALVLLPLLIQRGGAGVANGLRNLLIMVWGAYATVYLVCLLYWLVGLLNFWVFLIVLVLVQRLRR